MSKKLSTKEKLNRGEFFYKNGKYSGLAKQNDKGASFEKIADLIESNPRGLFEED